MKYFGPKRGRTATTKTIAAPIGGLNALDAVAQMPETDAIQMDNAFPRTADVVTRNGFQQFATGMTGDVETLLAYRAGSINQLFAISGGNIYNVTAGGAVGAPVVTGLSNSRWQYVNFGTVGGRFLYLVNGTDYALLYDGTTWKQMSASSTPAFTGVDTRTLRNCDVINSRMWFVENNSLRAWYLPLNSIAGAAASIDLSSLAKQGGSLAGVFGWSVASTLGMQNYTVFVTTEGEIFVYQGYDPTNAATWALASRARIGAPVGDRFWTRIGADIGIICRDGIIPLTKAMQMDREREDIAISYKIVNMISPDVINFASNFGWQLMIYPPGGQLFVNVPQQPDVLSIQYVMNTTTNAWCRYTGLNANCFEFLKDTLYFGGKGKVYIAENGNTDNGAQILSAVKQAFSYFGDPGSEKRFSGARPVITTYGGGSVAFDVNVDFEDKPISSVPTLTIAHSALMWPFPWPSPWGASSQVSKSLQFAGGIGFAAAGKMQMLTRGTPISWQATTFVYERGGSI